MIFGSQRDFNLLIGINRELLSDVIEQEILYYKMSLEETQANIYGEAQEKIYWSPVKVNCLIDRGEPGSPVDEFGPDITRTTSFKFLREDLKDVNTVPEIGDIIQWQEDYYEVDNTIENQLFVGRNENYNLTDYGPEYAGTLSIICVCHLTRADRVGIVPRYEASAIDPASILAASTDSRGEVYITNTPAPDTNNTPAPVNLEYSINGISYTPVKVSTLSWEPYRRLPIFMEQQSTSQIKFYWEDIYWNFMNLIFYKKTSDAFTGGIDLFNIAEVNGTPALNPYGPPADGNYIVNLGDISIHPNRSLGVSTVNNPTVMTVTNGAIQFLNRFNIGNGTMSTGAPAINTVTTAGSANGGLYTKSLLATNVYYNQGSSLPSYDFSSLLPISNQNFKTQILSTLTVPNANNQFPNWQSFFVYVNGPIQVGTKVRSDEYGINTLNINNNTGDKLFVTITEDPAEPARTLFLDKLELNGVGNTYFFAYYNPKFQVVRVVGGIITEVTPFSSIT